MTIRTNIKAVTSNFKRASVKIGKSRSMIGRAHTRAINRATKSGRVVASRKLAEKLGFPRSATKRIMRFQKRDRARKTKTHTTIFYHYKGFNVGRLPGKVTQGELGAKVGSRVFHDSFWVRTKLKFKSGKNKGERRKDRFVFKRKYSSRLPIVPVTVKIGKSTVAGVESSLKTAVPPVYKRRMQFELKRELKKNFRQGRII